MLKEDVNSHLSAMHNLMSFNNILAGFLKSPPFRTGLMEPKRFQLTTSTEHTLALQSWPGPTGPWEKAARSMANGKGRSSTRTPRARGRGKGIRRSGLTDRLCPPRKCMKRWGQFFWRHSSTTLNSLASSRYWKNSPQVLLVSTIWSSWSVMKPMDGRSHYNWPRRLIWKAYIVVII